MCLIMQKNPDGELSALKISLKINQIAKKVESPKGQMIIKKALVGKNHIKNLALVYLTENLIATSHVRAACERHEKSERKRPGSIGRRRKESRLPRTIKELNY